LYQVLRHIFFENYYNQHA